MGIRSSTSQMFLLVVAAVSLGKMLIFDIPILTGGLTGQLRVRGSEVTTLGRSIPITLNPGVLAVEIIVISIAGWVLIRRKTSRAKVVKDVLPPNKPTTPLAEGDDDVRQGE